LYTEVDIIGAVAYFALSGGGGGAKSSHLIMCIVDMKIVAYIVYVYCIDT